MPSTYHIRYLDAFGVLQATIANFESLEYARTVSQVGALTASLPPTYLPLFRDPGTWTDARIGVYKSIAGEPPALDLETLWLVQRVIPKIDGQGRTRVVVKAVCGNDLLRRRIVAYASGASQAQKTGAAGNLARAVVRENYVSATDTTRNLSSALFGVQADLGDGATLTKAFSRRRVLDVVRELVDSSAMAGLYLAFDVVAISEQALEFRVYAGQRGVDRRTGTGGQSAVLVGTSYGNLTDVELDTDASTEVTRVYALGQGEATARQVASANNTARQGVSPFRLIEDSYNANQTADATALTGEAQDQLRRQRVRQVFSGTFTPTAGVQVGRNIGWGDYVTAQAFDQTIDVRLDTVQVQVADGKEQITFKLRSDT